jgi:hypothetical protein
MKKVKRARLSGVAAARVRFNAMAPDGKMYAVPHGGSSVSSGTASADPRAAEAGTIGLDHIAIVDITTRWDNNPLPEAA